MPPKITGQVILVGAGPGDPGLITVRGAEWLKRADVVLYDYLVNEDLMRLISKKCKAICLGQHGRSTIWSQVKINERLVEEASAGKTVVRLKSGDPIVFGRAADEIEALMQHHIPFEIVPGITAALASGSYAGIPITHRDYASAVALITGREGNDKTESQLDYAALARFPGTLVFYMGVTSAKAWSTGLIQAGKSPDVPVALVRRCSWPTQQTIHCRLEEVADRLTPYSKFPPPVIAIVGEVTRLADTLSWFDKKPLFGQRVLVTRPADQSDTLAARLAEQGAGTIVEPAIEISDPDGWQPVDDAISRLREFDWLVFSSANGVSQFLNRVFALGKDVRALGDIKLAAIGPVTAARLRDYGLTSDLQPEEFQAEALAAALKGNASNKRFLLARASRGREVLREELEAAGGIVEQVVVYRSTDVAALSAETLERLQRSEIDWMTVTSSAIARSVDRLFGDHLKDVKLASISPVTTNTLRELGLEPSVEAEVYTMDGLVEAMVRHRS